MAWTLSGMGHSEGRQAGGCGNSAKSALTAVAMQGPAYAVTELFNPVHIMFQHISDHIVTVATSFETMNNAYPIGPIVWVILY